MKFVVGLTRGVQLQACVTGFTDFPKTPREGADRHRWLFGAARFWHHATHRTRFVARESAMTKAPVWGMNQESTHSGGADR